MNNLYLGAALLIVGTTLFGTSSATARKSPQIIASAAYGQSAGAEARRRSAEARRRGAVVRDHDKMPPGAKPLSRRDRAQLNRCVDAIFLSNKHQIKNIAVSIQGYRFLCDSSWITRVDDSYAHYWVSIGGGIRYLQGIRQTKYEFSARISLAGKVVYLRAEDAQKHRLIPVQFPEKSYIPTEKQAIDRLQRDQWLFFRKGWEAKADLIAASVVFRLSQSIKNNNTSAPLRNRADNLWGLELLGSAKETVYLSIDQNHPRYCKLIAKNIPVWHAGTFHPRTKKGRPYCVLKISNPNKWKAVIKSQTVSFYRN